MSSHVKPPQKRNGMLLVLGILLIAANLRAPITGVAPLLDMIREATGISVTQAGILTTLPLLAFGLISPFAATLASRLGMERSLFGSLVVIAGAIALRSSGSIWALFAGTAMLGTGIAIGNVLLPSLLKRDFPTKIGELTAAYALTAGAVAGIASAFAVPMASLPGMNWNAALAVFLVVPTMAAVAWIPQLRKDTTPAIVHPDASEKVAVWRSGLAWQVTLFFGLTSSIYYVIIGWLPTMLSDLGYSAHAAGTLHGVSQLASALPGLLLAPLLNRFSNQSAIAVATSLLVTAAVLGLWLAPGLAAVWVPLFGFSAGGCFILALAFVSLRARNTHSAAALSGMAQCVGYCMAAAAPPATGFLRETSGSWASTFALCALATILLAGAGYLVGRPATV